ncbi:MAG: HlyC/CorC family transporter [Planctomycetes bacterium]|nr:HlyC/CorC family transporter [Planctomycetota bacterium]
MIWLVLALLVVCSGTVSACETALFGLTRQTLRHFERSPLAIGRQVFRLMQRPRRVLMTVLITNTAVNVAVFVVSFVALSRYRDAHPTWAAGGGLLTLLVIILFGEIVPKAIALSKPERFAPPAGAIIAVVQVVLSPLLWVLGACLVNPIIRLLAPATPRAGPVTTEELRLLVEHSAQEGAISSAENNMLQAVIALGQTRVREVMTPRVDLQSVKIDDDPRAVLEVVRASKQRTLLVVDGDLDHVRGAVSTREVFLHPERPIRRLLRPAHFVPEQANLVQLLRGLQAQKVRHAVVVDEFGGTAGFVSTGDIIGRIVGDLPSDGSTGHADGTTERVDENTYRLPGDLSVRIWADRFNVQEIDRHISTVAGLVLSKLGRLPREGDTVRIRNLTLTVERMRNRRIEEVLLRRIETETDPGEVAP